MAKKSYPNYYTDKDVELFTNVILFSDSRVFHLNEEGLNTFASFNSSYAQDLVRGRLGYIDEPYQVIICYDKNKSYIKKIFNMFFTDDREYFYEGDTVFLDPESAERESRINECIKSNPSLGKNLFIFTVNKKLKTIKVVPISKVSCYSSCETLFLIEGNRCTQFFSPSSENKDKIFIPYEDVDKSYEYVEKDVIDNDIPNNKLKRLSGSIKEFKKLKNEMKNK